MKVQKCGNPSENSGMHTYPSPGDWQARPEDSGQWGSLKQAASSSSNAARVQWDKASSHPSPDTAPGDSQNLSGHGTEIPVPATLVEPHWAPPTPSNSHSDMIEIIVLAYRHT